jgi:hypothetical protein
VLSQVVTMRPCRLVEVQGSGAQQLGPDDWLARCDEGEYPLTRPWAEAIRSWEPECDGLIWRSKRDPDEVVVVLWGAPATASTGCALLQAWDAFAALPLDVGLGRLQLDRFLTSWRLYLER